MLSDINASIGSEKFYTKISKIAAIFNESALPNDSNGSDNKDILKKKAIQIAALLSLIKYHTTPDTPPPEDGRVTARQNVQTNFEEIVKIINKELKQQDVDNLKASIVTLGDPLGDPLGNIINTGVNVVIDEPKKDLLMKYVTNVLDSIIKIGQIKD